MQKFSQLYRLLRQSGDKLRLSPAGVQKLRAASGTNHINKGLIGIKNDQGSKRTWLHDPYRTGLPVLMRSLPWPRLPFGWKLWARLRLEAWLQRDPMDRWSWAVLRMQLRLFILQERDNSDSAYKDRLRLPLLQERLQHQQDRQRMKEIAVSGVIYVLYIGIYDIKVSIGELER